MNNNTHDEVVATASSFLHKIAGLFQRIDAVYESRLNPELAFSTEQQKLIERIHLDFVRAGAKFDAEAQEKYGKIMENLAVLTTKFAQV